jgi:hypothetical protein
MRKETTLAEVTFSTKPDPKFRQDSNFPIDENRTHYVVFDCEGHVAVSGHEDTYEGALARLRRYNTRTGGTRQAVVKRWERK